MQQLNPITNGFTQPNNATATYLNASGGNGRDRRQTILISAGCDNFGVKRLGGVEVVIVSR